MNGKHKYVQPYTFIICMLLAGIVTIAVTMGIIDENKDKKYKTAVAEYEQIIAEKNSELEGVNSNLDECLSYIGTLESKNDELATKNEEYKSKLSDYEKTLAKYQIQQWEDQGKVKSGQVSSLDTGFRSWMPYTALRSGTSQYKVVHMSSPNEYGILEYDRRAVVAVGFGWGLTIGDTATVTTTNGSYKIVVGDWKARCDTDSTNKVTTSNGCVVEFIVDRNSLAKCIRISGSVASVNKYSGKVLSITSDGSNIL